jgi:hypothetical protein
MRFMGQGTSIASLRSRVAALVEQEGTLLSRAFELSQAGGDRRGVDALFARVQAMQVERNSLKKQIGNLIGTHRLHLAAEVWQLGVYNYCQAEGGDCVHVRVTQGPLGLRVLFPGQDEGVRIETLSGTFDGPLGADGGAAGRQAADLPSGTAASAGKPTRATKASARARPAKKNPV